MPWFKLTVAYDGTEFSGWQFQPGRRTVQDELQRAWQEITGERVHAAAAGRTDAGVHALGQTAGIESATRLDPPALLLALNAKLPADVAVRAVELAPDRFHATADARSKRYRYVIYNDRRRPVFARRYAWHIPTPLDVAAMHEGAQHLVGTHDFACFQTAGSERTSTVRTIFAASVASAISAPGSARGSSSPGSTMHDPRAEPGADEEAALIAIEVEGDGFLYTMVRTIAGTLVEVGRGKRDPQWVRDVVASRDRVAAGQTAPPQGLCLLRVAY
ncbi:MAG TPA: tRNA pseudouridine(38-40) synthase TruA [Lacipirellulaceae bacterium]|nr:tRNA pseudouridine(38-40) synthase TruA [Lacipirellulaceae bacterium]